MREIKFRAWDTQYNKWAYFTLDHFISGDVTDIAQRCKDWCESTGLKDKNGKGIYEGDIVNYSYIKNHPRTHKIVYEPKAAAFLLHDVSKGSINYVQMKYLGEIVRDNKDSGTRTYELCEVIGNVYENGDLL